jgi:acyl-coenzyme A synthetase/AMP-(fatty) acid ligase
MKIHEHFELVAEENPSSIAISCDGRNITYAQLDSITDNLAASLLNILGPKLEPVATFIGLSEWFAITTLAVMKAGKFVAHIKTEQEDQNVALQFKTVDARMILTTRDYLPDVQRLSKKCLIYLVDENKIMHSNIPELLISMSYTDAAYLIFTSGSTGSAKAVVYGHNAQGHINDAEFFGSTKGSRIAQFRTGTAGIRHMLVALLTGATSIVRSTKQSMEINLGDWIKKEETEVICTTASSFRYLMTLGLEFPFVKNVEVGGEMVDWEDHELYKNRFSDKCLFSCRYANSECHVVTRLNLDKQAAGKGRLPVGFPVSGVRVKIVDKDIELNNNRIGEIAIKSQWGMLGYWRDLTTTTTKFINGWYLSGDLGWIDQQGCLHHEGRKDFQGKVKEKTRVNG